VKLAVDDGDFLARNGPDERLLVILTCVQVVVACNPLGAGSCLEVHGNQFDGVAALVAFGGLLLGAKVLFLESDPVTVKESRSGQAWLGGRRGCGTAE
jgi:hypothetical protein